MYILQKCDKSLNLTEYKYLSKWNTADNKENGVLIFQERIEDSDLYRFKIDEKYLDFNNTEYFMNSEKTDTSILRCVYKNSIKDDILETVFITVHNKYLQFTDKLCLTNTPVTINVEILNSEEILLTEFLNKGLVTWKSDSDFSIYRERILQESHTRISNLLSLSNNDSNFTDLLKDKNIYYILDRLFDGYHLTTFSSNTLRKGDPDGRRYHVDYPYTSADNKNLPLLGVQVIFALDDFTIENGATMYLDKGETKYILVPKNSVIMYRGDLVHSQGINLTHNPRVAVLANFAHINIPAKDEIYKEIVNNNLQHLFLIENEKILRPL